MERPKALNLPQGMHRGGSDLITTTLLGYLRVGQRVNNVGLAWPPLGKGVLNHSNTIRDTRSDGFYIVVASARNVILLLVLI